MAERKYFVGEDGYQYCLTCGERVEREISFPVMDGTGRFVKRKVHCTCLCEREAQEKIDARMRFEDEMRRVEELRRMSLMDSRLRKADLSTYKVDQENEKLFRIAGNYIKKFDLMLAENHGLLFYGPVGTGKSYTAAVIANELINRQYSVIMTSFVKLLQEVSGFDTDGEEYIARLNQAKLLIIDDLGTERSTDYALENVYNIIDSRYRCGKPLILTTNLDLQQMKECQDIRYSRIYDRIFEMCYPVKAEGLSWRKKEAAGRYRETKKLLEA